MRATIRARVRDGVFEPVDRIDLPEGTEVTLTILEVDPVREGDAFLRSRGGWKGRVDCDVLIQRIRDSRRTGTRPEPRLSIPRI